MSRSPTIKLQLLPHERVVLMKGAYTPREVLEQLKAHVSSEEIVTIRLTRTDLHLMAIDLTHEIVKRGRRGQDVFDFSERLDYVDDTGDGSLESWY